MARGDKKDLDPRDKPFAGGPFGLDPKKMKDLRKEAELYSNSMLEASESMKSQLDFIHELKREEGIRNQSLTDYLGQTRSISKELSNNEDFLHKINDGEIQLSEAKKIQKKLDEKRKKHQNDAIIAQRSIKKEVDDGNISKETGAKLQQAILDGLSESEILQGKIADGVTQATKGSNAFTRNIGGLSKFMKKAGFENASKHMSNMAKGVSKAKIAGGGFSKQMVAAGRAAKVNPYLIIAGAITGLVKMLISANQESAELGRNLGVSAAEASDIRNHFIDVAAATGRLGVEYKEVAKQNDAFNKALGTAAVFHKDIIGDMAVLVERTKMSQEAAIGFGQAALATKSSVSDLADSAFQGAINAQKEMGFRMRLKDIAEETATITGQLRGIYGANMELIGKAVGKARALGFALGEVANQSKKLLDFQTSIEAELTAELFLGKQLNLEKARLASLTGDYDAYMKEIMKNSGDFFEFSKMNVLQQDKLATALGMSSDQLSDMLLKRVQIGELQEAALNASTKEERMKFEQLSLQEKFNKALEKMKYVLINLVNRLEANLSDSFFFKYVLGLKESDFQMNPFGGDGEGSSTAGGRPVLGQSRIKVQDFTIETHPMDKLVMAGGTNLGGNPELMNEIRGLRRDYKDQSFAGNISYSGFDAVKAPTNYGTKFGYKTI